MGDRTAVTLSVLKQYVQIIEEIASDFDDRFDGADNTTCFTYYEVNYGSLEFLDKLRNKGIAYDSKWDAGSEYSAGTESCRFTPEGKMVTKEIYDNQIGINPTYLLGLINTPDLLIKTIKDHHDKISTLPWENQEEYGKYYCALQLINPTPFHIQV